MKAALHQLVALLELEPIEVNIYRGQNRDLGLPRVFGGQVLAQALAAARKTVEPDRVAHSLHAYFILPGDIAAPIIYDVDRIRDGGSFTTRRIRAIQHGRPIFNMSASFHRPETGFEHQDPMPQDVPDPETLTDELELIHAHLDRYPARVRETVAQPRPFTFRPVAPLDPFEPAVSAPRHATWFKTVDHLPDDLGVHQALFAYASDHGLLPTALRPHGVSWMRRDMQVASLDHALWFHAPFRLDEWLLYVYESPRAAGARGFTRGSLYTRDGALVASVAQEGLIRQRDPNR